MMIVKLSKKAFKMLNALDKPTKTRIVAAIQKIPLGDIRPLVGRPGVCRLRVGDWRILFMYLDEETVFIEKVSPRGDVYKGA